jgi:hypothetical protein
MNILFKLIHDLIFFAWDLCLALLNLLTPLKRKGHVVPKEHAGHGGRWPEYIAPMEGKDSRSACPALNAMANHGMYMYFTFVAFVDHEVIHRTR